MRTQILLASLLCASAVGFAQQKVGELANITRLTNDSEMKYENPRFSPDGKQLAFTQFGNTGLYVADLTVAEAPVKQISADLGVGYMFQWNADGTDILCRNVTMTPAANGFPRSYKIQSVNVATKEITELSEAGDAELRPAAWRYNRKGEASVVAAGRVLRSGIVSNTVAATPAQLQELQEIKEAPAFSVSFITDYDNLYVVDAAGNKKVIYEGVALVPALSPDGKKVAFCNMESEVLVMDVKGGKATVVGKGFNSTWVNNEQIVVENTTDNGHEYLTGDLFLLGVKDKSSVAITKTPGRIEMCPTVSADGNKIAFVSFTDGQVYIADLK